MLIISCIYFSNVFINSKKQLLILFHIKIKKYPSFQYYPIGKLFSPLAL